MNANELAGFASEVVRGLSQTTKAVSSKYFYDDEGSRLFQQIMALEEYYLTRSENEILREHSAMMVRRIPGGRFQLLELGAGDGAKTAVIIEAMQQAGRDFEYRPIDISGEAMRAVTERMGKQFPTLSVRGVVDEYYEGLRQAATEGVPSVVLFLGSNIGNFPPESAYSFLREIRRALKPGDLLLVGFDLVKDPDVLHRAYSDAKGVTAAFNFNLLTRINRELGGNFDIKKFRHCAAYNFRIGAMESYLVSLEKQKVQLESVRQDFSFDAWEPLFTECSFKYSPSVIGRMALAGGFRLVENYQDSQRWFCDSLWEVT